MKNIVFLVVDSLCYERINKYSMPFLYSMKNNSIWCENMYSEAPFTEAALISLLSGIDTLKCGGWMKRFDNKKTVFEVFQENGYKTFFNGFMPGIYASKTCPGIDDLFYSISFDFNSMEYSRLYQYSDRFRNDLLTKDDLNLCMDFLDVNFKECINFYNKILLDDKHINFCRKYYIINKNDIKNSLNKIEKEFNKFSKNKVQYTKEVLMQGNKHFIYSVKFPKRFRGNLKDNRILIYDKNKNILKKMFYKNIIHNVGRNYLPLKYLKDDFIQKIKIYVKSRIDFNILKKMDYNDENIKTVPSMYSHINHFMEWNKNNKDNFVAYIHVDDVHYPSMFYSSDIDNVKEVDKELEQVNNFLNSIPHNYSGALLYDSSLVYADYHIKRLYEYIKKNCKDTILCITADHGSSYTFAPTHYPLVNNINKENYHIPFIILNSDIDSKIINNYSNSKDIPATLLDLVNLKKPKSWSGESVLKKKKQDFVLTENVMGGCPDMHNRKIMISSRNSKYVVSMEFDLNLDFMDGKIVYVYDCINDKKEFINLNDKININQINEHISLIKKEFISLKKDFKINDYLK